VGGIGATLVVGTAAGAYPAARAARLTPTAALATT
jgi:putative ABC transport system permease protein